MGGRDRSGLALALLALAALCATQLDWVHFCDGGNCGLDTAWSHTLGVAIGLLAAALLVCESLPLLQIGRSRALLGASLGLAVAVTTGMMVGFEAANLDFYGGKPLWWGSWLGLAVAVLLLVTAPARLRGHVRDVPLQRPVPEWADAFLLGGGGLAFASAFLPWVVDAGDFGGDSVDGWLAGGTEGTVFGLLAVALVCAEIARAAGVRPARGATLDPATIVLAGLTALFGLFSLILARRELTAATELGHGAWLGLVACAALAAGAALRLRAQT